MQAETISPPYQLNSVSDPIVQWIIPRDPSNLVINAGVVIGHLILILWVILAFNVTPDHKAAPQRLVVQTIKLGGSKGISTSSPSKPETVSKPLPPPPPPPPAVEEKPVEKVEIKPVEVELEPEVVLEEAVVPEPLPEPVKEVPKEVPKKEVIEEPVKPPAPAKKVEPAKPKPKAPEKKVTQAKVPATKPQVAKKVDKPMPKNKAAQVAKKTPPKTNPAVAKKAEVKKVEAAPKPDPRIAAAKAKQKKLIAQAQENLAKIDHSRDKGLTGKISSTSSLPSIPGVIGSLEIDALPTTQQIELNAHEISYRDELAQRLKLMLRLPEYGKVKIKLTLERSGKVAKVEILAAESAANKKYIEQTLPSKSFPSFGSNFEGLNQYTFIISLSNE